LTFTGHTDDISKSRIVIAVLVLVGAAPAAAGAAGYPDHPARMIVPFTPLARPTCWRVWWVNDWA
jgi:hypothetical protein